MKSIYTYSNPFKIDEEQELWSLVRKYPHFCASDTLVQGMTDFYGRSKFNIIQTINELQKAIIGNVTNNLQIDMQLYLDVSHVIRNHEMKEYLRISIQNNINEVVSSIKYLLLLRCDVEKFPKHSLSDEQVVLLEIYSAVKERYECNVNKLFTVSKESIEDSIKTTILREVEYQIKKSSHLVNITDWHCNDYEEASEKLAKIKGFYMKKVESRDDMDFSNTAKDKVILSRLEVIEAVLETIEEIDCNAIVIHGVHKFTPEIMLLLKVLEENQIDVIFLIHYVNDLPEIYNTWKNVYSWTDCIFQNVKGIDWNLGREVGKEITKLYRGKALDLNLKSKKYEYENLSSFATSEVRKRFKEAGEELGKMKVQYYAVNNTETNEILRNYFPEQFECKPFLSYPIGQFILGIYNMWDFEKNILSIDENALKECATAGIVNVEAKRSMVNIIELIWPYISDLETFEAAYGRLELLIENIAFIKRNGNLYELLSIGYFSVEQNDVEILISFLKYIERIANSILSYEKEQIDYKQHFKNLMDVISVSVNKTENISNFEKQLVYGIFEALSVASKDGVIGDFKDVKDALTFYLKQREIDDTSNWIVRNFEQLDGAVLLSNSSKATEYHFALLSMKNMSKQKNEVLTWPLTEEMFISYEDNNVRNSVYACTVGLQERANFLRYSLFYGTYFSRKRISLSYVKNQNGEEQRPYYVLELLNLTKGKATRDDILVVTEDERQTRTESFSIENLGIREKEMFAICAHKFYLYAVLGEKIIYSNAYHIRYFLANFLTKLILEDSKTRKENVDKRIIAYMKVFKKLFPIFDTIVFEDIQRRVKRDVIIGLNYPKVNKLNYNRRKHDFLLAKWTDKWTKTNVMNFNDYSNEKIIEFMKSEELFMIDTQNVHEKICENCCYNEKCLMSYYNALAIKERGE